MAFTSRFHIQPPKKFRDSTTRLRESTKKNPLLENSIKELFFSKIKNDSSDEINFFGEDIFLEVYKKNLFAIKLYEKIGFEKISVRKNYYGQNKNAIIMMLKKLK